MIISDSHKFIFIHIPKTGGSSITWNLRRVINQTNPVDLKHLKIEIGWQHNFHINGQHSSYLENKDLITAEGHYFSFAFVRNPWSRLFSWYLVLSRNSGKPVSKHRFKGFLFRPPKTHATLICRPQWMYICNQSNEIMIDQVARFENFDAEFMALVRRLNITDYDNEKNNISNTNSLDYRNYYDSEGKEFINENCKTDIHMFGYQF